MLRRLIETAGDIQEMAYDADDDVDETLDRAEVAIFEVAEKRVADSLMPLYPALEQTMDQLEALYDRDTSIVGVPTGYHDLDELLLGLQPSTLSIVAARPGQGKTSLALGAALHVALRRAQAGAVLLDGDGPPRAHEASARGRGPHRRRASCRRAASASTSGRSCNQAVGRLAEAPFFIDDNPHCTVMEMRAKARRTKARYGDLGLIVVDYLQLMSSSQAGREPPGRSVGDVAWAEDPGARARGAGDVLVAAQPPTRVPPGQAPDARRPA